MHRRTWIAVAALTAAAAGLAAEPRTAAAKPRRPKPPRSRIVSVVTPLGLQGTRGAGGNVVIPFTVADIGGRPADVQVQYAFDRNADGLLTDDEFRPATEDRLDPRDTRRNHAPQLYPTGTNAGAVNAYVWRSLADVGRARFVTIDYAATSQGRYVPDPDNPGSFLFATGPNGAPILSGVKVRLRTALRPRRHRPWVYSEWAYSNEFSLNNSDAPAMTIDAVASGANVAVNWGAYDRDSEDFNGNGQLDVAEGEDVNDNGLLDCEKAGVAFDWHRLAPGEDPAAMSDAELAGLRWSPCTRVPGIGDTDSLDARPGVPLPTTGDLAGVCTAPPGVGRRWLFLWDANSDAGLSSDGLILRGTPFDEQRNRGATVYSRIVVRTAP